MPGLIDASAARPVHDADATSVIVNYNSGARLGPLFDLLEPEVTATVVVDNASSDGSLDAAQGRRNVTVVRNQSNRGFAAAANQGANSAEAAWLLFTNPDIHLRPGDVTALLRDLPADVAAVAPLQVDEQDRPRIESGGYQPSLSRYLVWAFLPVRYHRRWGPWIAPPFPTSDADADWVSGALLAIRRHVFTSLGGFDERFFLYHEDVDFCRRARQAGHRVWVRPSVHVFHEVAHGDPARKVIAGLRSIESLALTFSGWRRRVLGAILMCGYGLRAVLGSGASRTVARAVLPHSIELIRGRLPTVSS
jgi:N-acetylglucosaminyl-diphospho-decaprenol L-rhamnosyltransferase